MIETSMNGRLTEEQVIKVLRILKKGQRVIVSFVGEGPEGSIYYVEMESLAPLSALVDSGVLGPQRSVGVSQPPSSDDGEPQPPDQNPPEHPD